MKEFKYLINGNLYTATLVKMKEDVTEIDVNGKSYSVTSCNSNKKPVVYSRPAQASEPVGSPPAAASGQVKAVKAPLPGNIMSIDCKVGDTVKRGQKIIVLEAMKMENTIPADIDGKVSEILVRKGDTVLEGVDLVILLS
ncbi:acetyl-CoA carboxylase biotin carboxyl carrier protein subunit [Bacteroidia bacterium]|nr:acetyl-CoA carboxylase biotin carboxyl carrier protein subunit [Bacteroidia bacterium]